MSVVTRPSMVLANVTPRAEPPFDRLLDPLIQDLVAGGPLARDRFAARWADTSALAGLAEGRAGLPAPLAGAMREYHRRLGATPSSMRAIERLAAGEAVCALAGQQPAPLGGPLYSLHKIAAAVGIARRVEARTGVPCVPVFWNHTEDSDFAEIRAISVADPALTLHDLALPAEVHGEGGLIGAIAAAPVAALGEAALEGWSGLPGQAALAGRLRRAAERSRDLGELHAAVLLDLLGEQGLVVVDPRWPEFRAAARSVIDRYLRDAERLGAAVQAAGTALENRIGRRPLSDTALESFVFEIRDGGRHKISPGEARAAGAGATLSPSVALRPAVQDGVLPAVAMACGPGELAYLAQIREVYEGLGVRAACPVPRLGATWLPPAASALLAASGAEPWKVVAATDQVLRQLSEARVPPALRQDLERLRSDLAARLGGFAESARALDPSLPQIVESARGKMDYQVARLLDGLAGKARHRMEREHPEWLRLRYYLLPGDRLQERRLASLEPVAYRGPSVVADLCDLAEAHAERLERGENPHYLLELG